MFAHCFAIFGSIRTSSDDLELTSKNFYSIVVIEAIIAPNFVRSVHQTIFPVVKGPVGNLITKSIETMHQRFPMNCSTSISTLWRVHLWSSDCRVHSSAPTERPLFHPSKHLGSGCPPHLLLKRTPPAFRTYLFSTHDHGRPRSKCPYLASSPYVGSDPKPDLPGPHLRSSGALHSLRPQLPQNVDRVTNLAWYPGAPTIPPL